jgi:hypothetical protein
VTHELERLVAERESARFKFIQARLARDSAARYLDAVVDDPDATRAAWDAFTVKQEQMDRGGDQLNAASAAVIAYLIEDGDRRRNGPGATQTSSEN